MKNMKILFSLFAILLPTIAFNQSNPNDAPIEQRLHLNMIKSFVLEMGNLDDIFDPTFLNNKSVDQITINVVDSLGNSLTLFDYQFSYDQFCRITNISRDVPLYPGYNQNWYINWQNNQVGITLPEYISGEDSTRFLFKYDVNNNITAEERQIFSTSGSWEGDMDYGSKYSNFDPCGNYLYETTNYPFDTDHAVDMTYLNNGAICLPVSKTYSFPQNGGIKTFKETWNYTPFFDKKDYKLEITNTAPGSGFVCQMYEYSYNSNNKLDTLREVSCFSMEKNVRHVFTWNSDGSVDKIIDFDPSYTEIGGVSVEHIDAIFSYNGCVASGIHEIVPYQVKLTPNPVFNNLTVELANWNEQDYSFNILNSIGEVVLQKRALTSSKTIDLNLLPQGMYFLQIVGKEGFVTKQFVKM